jgi:hypothetical protein
MLVSFLVPFLAIVALAWRGPVAKTIVASARRGGPLAFGVPRPFLMAKGSAASGNCRKCCLRTIATTATRTTA